MDMDGLKALAEGLAVGLAVLAPVAAITVPIYYYVKKAQCESRTAQIGYPSRYSLFGGCQIEVSEGRWIPLDSFYFRQVEPTDPEDQIPGGVR